MVITHVPFLFGDFFLEHLRCHRLQDASVMLISFTRMQTCANRCLIALGISFILNKQVKTRPLREDGLKMSPPLVQL